jgi:type IV pilus assembly protein PilM
LLDALKGFWKKNKIKPRFVRLVIQDQNILVREFVIQKVDLEKKSIEEYFYNQFGKKFHVLFENPVISYQIINETMLAYNVLLYIADENLLQDYYDILEHLGVKDVIFDIAISALMEIADEAKDMQDVKEKNAMIVSIYDKLISFHILEKNRLIFGAIEECDGNRDRFKDTITNNIERIANYYRYNLRKGKSQIEKTLVFNLNDYLDSKELKEAVFPDLKHMNIHLYYSESIQEVFKDLPKGSLVAFGSNEFLQRRQKDKKIIDFQLKRINQLRLIGYYFLVLTITIFASISLLYIPYNQSRDQINDQRYQNETLEYQINRLQNYIDNQQNTQTNSSLVSAYNLIESKQDDMPIDYFLDLVDIIPGTITITDYEFNVLDKSMKVTITSDDTEELINYILQVHERFKIDEDNINQNQWITIMPDTVFLTGNVCEVTIYYA